MIVWKFDYRLLKFIMSLCHLFNTIIHFKHDYFVKDKLIDDLQLVLKCQDMILLYIKDSEILI